MDLRKNCLQKATELESHLKTHTYLYVKDIIAHVKITYEFEYSIAGMRNWLHKHGFSYKKPPIVPGKANQLECLWKWMKERIIDNTYYEYFEDFKAAIFGFFSMLSTLDPESILGKCFRSRVRDKFSPLGV